MLLLLLLPMTVFADLPERFEADNSRVIAHQAYAEGMRERIAAHLQTRAPRVQRGLAITAVVDRADDDLPPKATACATALADGDCTLRGAILAANANAGADQIFFDRVLMLVDGQAGCWSSAPTPQRART